MELTTKVMCGRCMGSGIDDNGTDIDGNPISIPCVTCDGSGWREGKVLIDISSLEDTINQIAWIKKKIKKILQKLELPDDDES